MLTGPSQSAARGRVAARTVSRRPRSTRSPHASPPRATRPHTPASAPLRLVGQGDPSARPTGLDPIQGTHDPRWVLAVRVSEKLEGTLLRPEHREQLVRLGRMLGLSVFDCNLVIAIVQDQARRGHQPNECPTAGEDQLRMIPLPTRTTILQAMARRPAMLVAGILATLILIELALLNWLL
ncbi:hypothetical protein ACERK3_16055 [Phycisphaerales bacterium AB-hyl4]|uniref:Uncharacterized protein n=1 Tax=Natronomicrosphaera hydrolytica TaxID=3242702 RepID=A0ABV4UAK4_9BACT